MPSPVRIWRNQFEMTTVAVGLLYSVRGIQSFLFGHGARGLLYVSVISRPVCRQVAGGHRGLALARWTQSSRPQVRYCPGASFIKIISTLFSQAIPDPIQPS